MTNDENANGTSRYAKKKVIRKPMKVDSANVALANCEGFGPLSHRSHEMPQLSIEFICKFSCTHFLVISHDAIDIRVHLRMKNEPHQIRRRRPICWSSSLSEIADTEFASSSASRRSASAIPSSSS